MFLHFGFGSSAHSSILFAAFFIRELHFELELVLVENPRKEINKQTIIVPPYQTSQNLFQKVKIKIIQDHDQVV